MAKRPPQPTIAPRERAFLVGVELFKQKTFLSLGDSLTELALLADTSGLEVVGELTQKLDRPHVKTYIGPGKVEELGMLIEETLTQVVIFDDELSPRHQRELQEILGRNVRVLDRTALILDIFAQHAHTSEGMLQVELAQYEYYLPRLTGQWTHLERQAGGGGGRAGSTGGVGLRGPGETQLEVDKRAIRKRIAHLKKELEKVRAHRMRYRAQRKRSRIPTVALVGYTNAGKSTLLNTLVGAKVAIVSDKPQTTRTRILGVKNYPDGQIVFVDTPGIHRPLHRMNVRMVDAAVDTLREVDVVVVVFDATSRPGQGDEYVSSLLARVRTPVVLALNKIDVIAKSKLLPLIERVQKWHSFAAIVPVSAQTGDGVDRLERVLLEHLPEGEPPYPDDFLTDQPERTLVAETVREKILHHTRAELPFSTAVVVDQFDESERDTMLRLYCTILVEQESQKAIVIGRGGDMIKRIGTEARKELEQLLETRVFLDLRVKVNPDWRDDDRALDEMGVPRSARRRRSRGASE